VEDREGRPGSRPTRKGSVQLSSRTLLSSQVLWDRQLLGLSAFAAGCGGTLAVMGEVATALVSALPSGRGCQTPVFRKAPVFRINVPAALAGNVALPSLVHGRKSAL
jgi:hypothetical protein